MKTASFRATLVLVCAVVLGAMAPAQGAKLIEPDADAGDRALFQRLIREIHQIDRKADQLMERAVAEARANEGRAHPETKACLLSLRDARDRAFSRLLVLSMRHGWETPDFDQAADGAGAEAAEGPFESVDVLVRRELRGQARDIVDRIRLPVVSLELTAR